ncbi:MAG TPA: hypothetical protein VKF35_09990, partial [Hyphomicrobiaceae bacterium]|nr:hypothetical protein [Hyphomicrobiaceae bacterium]
MAGPTAAVFAAAFDAAVGENDQRTGVGGGRRRPVTGHKPHAALMMPRHAVASIGASPIGGAMA